MKGNINIALGPNNFLYVQGGREKLCYFQEISLYSHLPSQALAAIGCTEIGQPIGVPAHFHCVQSFENVLRQM